MFCFLSFTVFICLEFRVLSFMYFILVFVFVVVVVFIGCLILAWWFVIPALDIMDRKFANTLVLYSEWIKIVSKSKSKLAKNESFDLFNVKLCKKTGSWVLALVEKVYYVLFSDCNRKTEFSCIGLKSSWTSTIILFVYCLAF